MARVNVYLPDELAAAARAAGVNVSGLAQAALRHELQRQGIAEWVAALSNLPGVEVGHDVVIEAVREARDEMGDPDR